MSDKITNAINSTSYQSGDVIPLNMVHFTGMIESSTEIRLFLVAAKPFVKSRQVQVTKGTAIEIYCNGKDTNIDTSSATVEAGIRGESEVYMTIKGLSGLTNMRHPLTGLFTIGTGWRMTVV